MSQVKSNSRHYKPKVILPRDERAYWSISQVCEEFSVHDRTVRRWLSNGTLKGIRTGGVVRISREEIEKLRGGRS